MVYQPVQAQRILKLNCSLLWLQFPNQTKIISAKCKPMHLSFSLLLRQLHSLFFPHRRFPGVHSYDKSKVQSKMLV